MYYNYGNSTIGRAYSPTEDERRRIEQRYSSSSSSSSRSSYSPYEGMSDREWSRIRAEMEYYQHL